MARAIWNEQVIAESDNVVEVDGYTYFPDDAVRWDYLHPSTHRSVCGWKGEASYFTIDVDGVVNENGAWQYRDPSDAAAMVRGRTAFWHGVDVEP